MKIENRQQDRAILAEIGSRLAQKRIAMSLTQAELAKRSGVSKRTLERLEKGDSVQFTNVIRVLAELGLIDTLVSLLPQEGPGPMELLKRRGKPRKRVRGPAKKTPEKPFFWGDEE